MKELTERERRVLKERIKEHQRLIKINREEQLRLEGLIKYSEEEIDKMSKLLYGKVFIEKYKEDKNE